MKTIPTASVRTPLRTLPMVAALFAGLVVQVSPAVAQVAAGLKASLIVRDDATSATTTVSLEHLFTFNSATGQHQLVTPGTPLAGTGWRWANEPYMTPGTTDTQTNRHLRLIDESQTTITLANAIGKIDPFMTYSLSVKNNTASTQTYTFVFGEAMVPAFAGDYTLFADMGVSLSTSTPPATIAPVGLKLQDVRLSTDGGLTTFSGGVSVGNALTRATPGTATAYDASGIINGTSALPLNYWEFQTTFTLTPGGDAVGISGFAEIIPIPEPGALALLGSIGVFAFTALRRSRAGRASALQA